VSRHVLVVAIGAEHDQVVAHAQLCQERIDGPDLHALAPARVANLGRGVVVLSVRHQQWQGPEVVHDGVAIPGSVEALEEFL